MFFWVGFERSAMKKKEELLTPEREDLFER